MTTVAPMAIIAAFAEGAAGLRRRYRRARRNAGTIRYLRDMPPYLLNDIGLPPDADIRDIVERGR